MTRYHVGCLGSQIDHCTGDIIRDSHPSQRNISQYIFTKTLFFEHWLSGGVSIKVGSMGHHHRGDGGNIHGAPPLLPPSNQICLFLPFQYPSGHRQYLDQKLPDQKFRRQFLLYLMVGLFFMKTLTLNQV